MVNTGSKDESLPASTKALIVLHHITHQASHGSTSSLDCKLTTPDGNATEVRRWRRIDNSRHQVASVCELADGGSKHHGAENLTQALTIKALRRGCDTQAPAVSKALQQQLSPAGSAGKVALIGNDKVRLPVAWQGAPAQGLHSGNHHRLKACEPRTRHAG